MEIADEIYEAIEYERNREVEMFENYDESWPTNFAEYHYCAEVGWDRESVIDRIIEDTPSIAKKKNGQQFAECIADALIWRYYDSGGEELGGELFWEEVLFPWGAELASDLSWADFRSGMSTD